MDQKQEVFQNIQEDNNSNIISLDLHIVNENQSELHRIEIDNNTQLKNISRLVRKKIKSSAQQIVTIKFLRIGDKCYGCLDERNLRQLNVQDKSIINIHYFINTTTIEEIQIVQSNKPEVVNLSVVFHFGNSKQYEQIQYDVNTPLKTFVDYCTKNIRKYITFQARLDDNNQRIRYVVIADKEYDENLKSDLKELGVESQTIINIYIEKKLSIRQSLKNLQFASELSPIWFQEQEQLVMNYQNIIFTHLDQHEQKQIIQSEKEILMQNFFNPKLNKEFKSDQDFHQKKSHLMNNALRRNLQYNKQNNNIIDPAQGVNQPNNDQELLMQVLANSFKQSGLNLFQTKKYDQLNLLSLQASFDNGLGNENCLQLTIQNTELISFQLLKDQKILQHFQNQIKQQLAKQFKINPEDVILLEIDEGSIKIQFTIPGVKDPKYWENSIEELYKQYPNAEIVLHKYFQEIQLNIDDFDPRFNIEWSNYHKEYELRGPKSDQIKYFFPRGWKGYALRVQGKYDEGNDDWLQMDGNPNEWHIMYHGTSKDCVQKIVEKGLEPGKRQLYDEHTDIRFNQVVGKGVYFSNHIEIAEMYAPPYQIGGFKYRVVFQSRVRPSSLKQISKWSEKWLIKLLDPDWYNDYFVVNKREDIRPYRILMKKEQQGSCDLF